MAANYTASTNNHLSKCRRKLHVVTGNAKKMIICKEHINYEEIAQK